MEHGDHAVRFYLTSLYARNHGVACLYFYARGNGKLPLVLQAEGQLPTKAGLFVGLLQAWLSGTRLRGCGHGPEAALPDNVWRCEFRYPTAPTACALPASAGPTPARPAPDGSVQWIRPGDVQPVTERPVLIEYG